MAPRKKTDKSADKAKKTDKAKETESLVEESKNQAPILAILTKARTSAKKSIPQMSKVLNIQTHYLRALEEGDTDTLPETVYALGFVRSVANHLNLDANRCVKDYKDQILFNRKKEETVAVPLPPKESMAPKRAMLFISFLLVIGGYVGWLYVTEENNGFFDESIEVAQNEDPDEGETLFDVNEPEVEDPFAFEDQPVDKKTAEELKKKAIQIEASLKPQEPKDTKKKEIETDFAGEDSGLDHSETDIIIVASQRSWIEIKDKDKKILYRGILKEGETYPVPKGEGMIFTTGNAGGISFSYKGKKTPTLGRSGQVVRRVPLTKESLASIGKPENENPSATEPKPQASATAEAENQSQEDEDTYGNDI